MVLRIAAAGASNLRAPMYGEVGPPHHKLNPTFVVCLSLYLLVTTNQSSTGYASSVEKNRTKHENGPSEGTTIPASLNISELGPPQH